jgi:hypothetical protein
MQERLSPSKQAQVVSRTMQDAVHPNDLFLNGVKDKIVLHNEETIISIKNIGRKTPQIAFRQPLPCKDIPTKKSGFPYRQTVPR